MTKVANDTRGFAHIWVLFVTVLLVVGGTGYVVMRHNQQQINRGVQTSNTSDVKSLSTNLDGLLTTSKVQELATQDAPGTKVLQIGLVQTGGGPVFHIQLAGGLSLDLDAKTGAKVSASDVSDSSEGDKIPAGFTPSIDFTKAEQIARGKSRKALLSGYSLRPKTVRWCTV